MLRKRTLKAWLLLVWGSEPSPSGWPVLRRSPVRMTRTLQAKIENAMSAAPSSISENATILDNELDDAGKFVVLREGSNGWYLFSRRPRDTGS